MRRKSNKTKRSKAPSRLDPRALASVSGGGDIEPGQCDCTVTVTHPDGSKTTMECF